ncbi:MAG: response regulator [Pyrinomonadaceae bacterium]
MRFDLQARPSDPRPAAHATELQTNETSRFDDLLAAGVRSAQAGERVKARELLHAAAEIEPRSESVWMWLASISEYPEELLACLDRALEINPDNEKAKMWRSSTRLLMARTLVQRGLDALNDGGVDTARRCLEDAIEFDADNGSAWLALASIAETDETRLACLDRVLAVDPENEEARAALRSANDKIASAMIARARQLAAAGDAASAIEAVDAMISRFPAAAEAWELKAHLATDLAERFRTCEMLLAIDPDNEFARSMIESLKPVFAAASLEGSPSGAETAEPSGDRVSDDTTEAPSPSVDKLSPAETEASAATVYVSESGGQMALDDTDDVLELTPPDGLDVAAIPAEEIADIVADDLDRHSNVEAVDSVANLGEAPATILVVEDNSVIRRLIGAKLEERGYSVVCAEDGRAAAALIRDLTPDLVLLDITLAKVDGYDICRTIRTNPTTREVPVVMISGKDGVYEEAKGIAAGANGFITKPFGPETLMKTVERFLGVAPAAI